MSNRAEQSPAPDALLACLLLLVVALPGCGWLDSESDGSPDEPLVTFEPAEDATDARSANSGLTFQLNVADRYPLIKTVEQTLAQRAGDGSTTSQSQLDLYLELSVEEARDDGRRRLRVQYHRVRYIQDLGGQTIEYDSSLPRGPIPVGVLAYHGLVNNGFSFWIGADNRVLELVGFDEFLKRCVSDISLDRRARVLNRLSTSSVEDAVASFLDESIGLLRYGDSDRSGEPAAKIGGTWTQARSVDQPVPIHLSQRYTLKELNDRVAGIDVVGTITPQDVLPSNSAEVPGINIAVRGGHVFGNCSIDVKTGLPLNARVERRVEMTVTLGPGREFEQTKRTVTSIRALPLDQTAQAAHTPQTFAGAPRTAAGLSRTADTSSGASPR